MERRHKLVVMLLAVVLTGVPASAAVRTWDGGGADSEWTTPGNWNPDGYSDTDNLTVLSGTPTSTVNVVADNGGTITLDGSTAVANFSLDTYIGYTTGESWLNVLNGANLTNDYGRLGFYDGTSGIATVSGAGSTWTNSGSIYVGGGWSDTGGTGELIIADGGVVSCVYSWLGYSTGSSGAVTVNGAGSTWTNSNDLYVGRKNSGELTITGGGFVESKQTGFLGYYSGSSGTTTVSGAGSKWSNSELYVGYSGTGELIITDMGTVLSNRVRLGFNTGSSGTATVSGAGTTWTSSYLYVGQNGTGVLNITGGGAVSNSVGGFIGYEAGSTGVVTVDGSGSTWTCDGSLYVGHSGQGTLNITNGGTVNVTDHTWVAEHDGAAGEIHFDGGTLTTRSLLTGPTQLTGTGTINTHGLVSDVDLLFDSTHGPNQTLMLNSQPGQNITINLTQDSTGALGAGYAGNGTLSIRDGVSVDSSNGYIGYKAGATGEVTVDGSGSTWTNSVCLTTVGYYGHGTLNITDGGAFVSNGYSYIGDNSGSIGAVTVDGSGSTWTSDYLYVGDEGQGTLNITNGGAVISSEDCAIGRKSGSTGEVTVDGSGSTWTNSRNLFVGHEGQGTLNITNGGAVSNYRSYIGSGSGSTGEVTVDGSGSTWTCGNCLYVGRYGQGTLNITNGGVVSNTYSCIGYHPGSTGEVTVDGSGSTWTNSKGLSVGYGDSGQGTLNIINGGAVSNTYGCIGRYSGSTGEVTVDGSGSTWTNSDSLHVGCDYYCQGTLNITNGGAVSNTDGYIGASSGSTGVVTVDGSGSTWTNSSELSVGYYKGEGTLNITNGGAVSNSGDGYIGSEAGATGVVMVDGSGSTWTNSGSLYVGGSTYSVGGTGELTIDGGAVDVGKTLKIWGPGTVNLAGGTLIAATLDHTDGGAFNFTGGLLNVETFTGNMVNNGGTISPGSSPGLMTVEGDLTMNAGYIEIELAGSMIRGADYDAINVTGNLTLAGTLNVVLIDNFEPELNDAFDLLDWSSLDGQFDSVNLPGLSGDLVWDTSDLYSDGSITVVPEPASATVLLLGAVAMLLRRKKLIAYPLFCLRESLAGGVDVCEHMDHV